MQPAPLLSCCLFFFHVGCSDFPDLRYHRILDCLGTLLELALGSLGRIRLASYGAGRTVSQKNRQRRQGKRGFATGSYKLLKPLPLRPTTHQRIVLPHFGYPSLNTQQPAFCFFAFSADFSYTVFCLVFSGRANGSISAFLNNRGRRHHSLRLETHPWARQQKS